MKKFRRKAGFAYLEIVAVAALVSSVSFAGYQVVRKGNESACQNNLKQIYLALMDFQMDNGSLPNAVFFPRSANDPKGINNILKASLSGNAGVFFCPSLHSELNKYGTNYLWNDTVSGKSLDGIPGSTWLMTEMTAVSPDTPPPHNRGYDILYADGTVSVGPRVEFPTVVPAASAQPAPSLAQQKPEPEEPTVKPVELRVENLPEKVVAGKLHLKIVGYGESGKVAPVDRTVSLAGLNESIRPETVFLSKGVWEGDLPLAGAAEADTIFIVDEEGTFSSVNIDVGAGPPEKIDISLPKEKLQAGEQFEVEVSVEDGFGHLCRDWEGSLALESSDPAARILKDFTLDKNDAGRKKAALVFLKAGNQKVKITGLLGSGRSVSAEKAFVINPGPLDRFAIDKINSPKIAGEPFNIFIHSEDRWGNAVKGLDLADTTGTLVISRENYASGTRVEEVLVTRAAKETRLTVADGNGHSGQSNPFEVKPAAPAYLGLGGLPRVAEAGREYEFKVIFSDRYGNAISDYAGELEFTSSDKSFRCLNGSSVVFGTPGKQTLTVKDKKTGFALEWPVLVVGTAAK